MKHPITLGVVCLARKTFDFQAAAGLYRSILADLAALENVKLEAVAELVIEPSDAQAAARRLEAAGIDGLVCIAGTFHLGHLVLELHKVLGKPILLWGLPELPYDGGKIRLNSVCGVNLDASNLYKAGYAADYHVSVGKSIDRDWVDALRVIRAFKGSHIGLAGYRAHGFFNVSVADSGLYRETGVLLDHYELDDIFRHPVDDREKKRRRAGLTERFDLSGISDAQLEKVAELAVKFDRFFDQHGLDLLAIRCWPEFAGSYGISPCAAMSLLQSEGRLMACEGDIEGALSMLAHKAVGAETPFLFDFSQVDLEKNFALFWHCGVAPCNLWDGRCVRSLDSYFAGGKGVTADFVLKDGELSILRLDSALGEYRLLLGKARAVPMEKELKGTYLKAVFDEPIETVLRRVVDNGFAHHASVVYGDFVRPFRLLARIKGWKVVE